MGGEKAPIGNHPAVLVAIVGMGTQWQDGFQGAPGGWEKRAYFVWELVSEAKADGFNHVLGIDLKLSMHEKSKLRKWVESRRGAKVPDGAEFDISSEIGQTCLLNVVANKGGYPKIEGVGSLPKGMTAPKPKRTPFTWNEIASLKPGQKPDLPAWLPWLYGKTIGEYIATCQELGGIPGGSINTQAGSQQQSHAAPATNGAPPRRHTAPPDKFWVEVNPDSDAVLMDRVGVDQHITAQGKKAEEVFICPEGSAEYKPASAYGFISGAF